MIWWGTFIAAVVIAVVAIWLSPHRREDFVRLMLALVGTFTGVAIALIVNPAVNRQETELRERTELVSVLEDALLETTAHAGDVDWDAYRLMISSNEPLFVRFYPAARERMMAQVWSDKSLVRYTKDPIRRALWKTQYAITHFGNQIESERAPERSANDPCGLIDHVNPVALHIYDYNVHAIIQLLGLAIASVRTDVLLPPDTVNKCIDELHIAGKTLEFPDPWTCTEVVTKVVKQIYESQGDEQLAKWDQQCNMPQPSPSPTQSPPVSAPTP